MPRTKKGQATSRTTSEPTMDTEAHSINQDVRREKKKLGLSELHKH